MSHPATADSLAFKRINKAMLYGGFSAFALLYSLQPLMPVLGHQFALTPAQSSWTLSVSTLCMAIALLLSGPAADRIGSRRLMSGALAAAAVLTILCAFAQDFSQLLVLRALLGFALGGMPAVAMAYLAREIEAGSLGLSMGMYIGGTAVGGMAGRMVASLLSDFFSWRLSMAVIGAAGLVAALEFWRNLPEPRHAACGQGGLLAMVRGAGMHLRDSGMCWLFLLGFLLMGAFVSLYNYIGFRLLGAPFGISQSAVGLLSVLYLIGMFSAVWAGRLADRIGRRHVLWMVMAAMLAGLLLTLSDALVIIVAGMALFTFSFFASHSVASSWVGRRARGANALASALYLFFYYVGSSMVGSLCGLVWSSEGWPGVVVLLALTLGAALAIALHLRGLEPLAPAQPLPV
jgi:YNFM family putative membrane transporter